MENFNKTEELTAVQLDKAWYKKGFAECELRLIKEKITFEDLVQISEDIVNNVENKFLKAIGRCESSINAQNERIKKLNPNVTEADLEDPYK
jgi:hypothetical protein|tara:strand:- start:157 stop:432 length:276 start_codon:yes stop_codon:yes gene_type:complete